MEIGWPRLRNWERWSGMDWLPYDEVLTYEAHIETTMVKLCFTTQYQNVPAQNHVNPCNFHL